MGSTLTFATRFRCWVSRIGLFFLLLGTALRLWRWYLNFPLWGDEAFLALNIEEKSFAAMAQPLRHYQIAPLGFLWVEKSVCLLIGLSELALRLFPCLAGILALVFFLPFAKKVAPGLPALWASAILSVSYYPIRHSCEVKPYATDLLVSILFLALGAQGLKKNPKAFWLLALFAPVGIFLSFPSIFVALAAIMACIPLLLNPALRASFLIAFCSIVFSFLSHFFMVGQIQFDNENTKHLAYWDSTFPPSNPLEILPWMVQTHAGNMSAYPFGGKNGGSTLTLILYLAGIYSLIKKKKLKLLALLLAPFFFTLCAAFLGKYPYGGSARVAQHLAPSICLLAGMGLAFFSRSRLVKKLKPWPRLALLLLLFSLGIGQAVRDWQKPFKSEGEALARTTIKRIVHENLTEKPLFVTREKDQIDPTIEWYLRRGGNNVVFLPALKEMKGPLLWFWLPHRIKGEDTLTHAEPETPLGWKLISRKDFIFPLGRDQQLKIQFALLVLEQ